jgi:hypothetical protein
VAWSVVGVDIGVGVCVVATVELPYTEAAQMQRSSAAMSVPHPRPIFVLRERVLNQCLNLMVFLEALYMVEVVDTEIDLARETVGTVEAAGIVAVDYTDLDLVVVALFLPLLQRNTLHSQLRVSM